MGTGIRLAGRHQNGTEFPIDVSLSTVGAGPDMTAVAFIRDLTDPLPTHAHAGAQQFTSHQRSAGRPGRTGPRTELATRGQAAGRPGHPRRSSGTRVQQDPDGHPRLRGLVIQQLAAGAESGAAAHGPPTDAAHARWAPSSANQEASPDDRPAGMPC